MTDYKIAAVYIRVSTDDQVELSPDSQLGMLRDYAAKNGYIIPDEFIFVDPGISGRSAKNRPAFNNMIAAAKKQEHPFDAILLWKFSRFARNQEESIVYKTMLRKSGVDVVSISEPIIDGPFGSLIERIIEWMDEYYSIRLSGEVKRSMTVNAQRGVRQTTPPFGYVLGPKDGPFMVPEPHEADIVREVFRRYVSGDAMKSVAADLTARGVRTHRGGKIENRTLTFWLRNPAYVGMNRWTPGRQTDRYGRSPNSIITRGDHEPIITQEIFDAANRLLDRNSEKYRKNASPSRALKDWMGGIVRCAACGNTLIFQQPRYMICNSYAKGACPHRQMIRTDDLHEAVIGQLRADLSSADPLRYTLSAAAPTGTAIAALEMQLTQLGRKLDRIRDAYASGIDTMEEYKAYRESISAEQTRIRGDIESLRAQQDPVTVEASLRESIRKTLKTLEAPDTSLEAKNDAAREVIESCTWDRSTSTLSITYRVFI